MKEHPKLLAGHVIYEIKPRNMQKMLRTDLKLAHVSLNSDFKGFQKHAMNVAEAFQIIRNETPPKSRTQETHISSILSQNLLPANPVDK